MFFFHFQTGRHIILFYNCQHFEISLRDLRDSDIYVFVIGFLIYQTSSLYTQI
jgi:hypothetical protein